MCRVRVAHLRAPWIVWTSPRPPVPSPSAFCGYGPVDIRFPPLTQFLLRLSCSLLAASGTATPHDGSGRDQRPQKWDRPRYGGRSPAYSWLPAWSIGVEG